jgi:predicted NAD/FAD-dependent oxidoreductase
MHGHVEPFVEFVRLRNGFVAQPLLPGLHRFVICLNDGILAWELVVSRTFRNICAGGDYLHCGRVEAVLAKQSKFETTTACSSRLFLNIVKY